VNDQILIYEREYSRFAFGPWVLSRRDLRFLPEGSEPQPEWSTPCLYSVENPERAFYRERTRVYER
jgi:hypothetical protein